MMFFIDFDKFAKQHLLPLLAKGASLAFVQVMLSPLALVNQAFVSYRSELIKRLRYNGQVIILENLLNDYYDANERRIYIETVDESLSAVYVYRSSEGQIKEFVSQYSEGDPLYVFRTGEQFATGYDFIVWAADDSLSSEDEQRIKATVNRYKLAGKRAAYKYFSGANF